MTSPTPQAPAREAVDVIAELKKAAEEIANCHMAGWGNTCINAAEFIAAKQEELDKMRADAERQTKLFIGYLHRDRCLWQMVGGIPMSSEPTDKGRKLTQHSIGAIESAAKEMLLAGEALSALLPDVHRMPAALTQGETK